MMETIKTANKLLEDGCYVEAFPIYLEHAQQGNLDCCRYVGWMYLKGAGIGRDIEKALYFFDKAGSEDLEVRFGIAKVYIVKNNMVKAISMLMSLSDLDYAPAHYRLGKLYQKGQGVDKNIQTAFMLYKKGARQRHLSACREEAYFLIRGGGGIRNIPLGFYKFFMNIINAIDIIRTNDRGDIRKLF